MATHLRNTIRCGIVPIRRRRTRTRQQPIIELLRDGSPLPISSSISELAQTIQAPFELQLRFDHRAATELFGKRLYSNDQHWT